MQAATKVFLDRLVNIVLGIGIFKMWIFQTHSLEYFNFIHIIYFMVIMWGPYLLLKMIKKLLMGLFGFYVKGTWNNKTNRNIFYLLLGKKSCSFFKFLLMFPVNTWMKHHNGSSAIVVESFYHLALTIGFPCNQHQFPTLKGVLFAESFDLLSARGEWTGLNLSELRVWQSCESGCLLVTRTDRIPE